MYFGLNEAIIQKLIDFMGFYYYQANQIAVDLVEAKVDLRNLFVFLNN